ncbi:hypothetical protein AB4Y45_34750 [Paraburkholderia sp. EG287A]|uniref:hypothetical protein n=1 Tax=Paraburkholderia sp. EG287A TaxID=3237012 RepID=UPI0034D22716
MPNDITVPEGAAARVAASQQNIKEARRRRQAAEHLAHLAFEEETAVHTRMLSDLVGEYEERAIELAEDDAPVSRSRVPLRPTEITATPDGLELFWEADWPAYPVTHTVTWAALMSKENKHANG